MNDQEKAVLGKEAFGEFFQQFGNDIYAKILLEVLFEELCGVDSDNREKEE